MNKIALVMQVIETKECLFSYQFDQSNWNASFVITLDESKQIFTKGFKDNADMDIFRRKVLERIKKRYDMTTARMGRICCHDLAKQFNLITSGFYKNKFKKK
jgi:hypothetical protein